jgi:hypothetical protein
MKTDPKIIKEIAATTRARWGISERAALHAVWWVMQQHSKGPLSFKTLSAELLSMEHNFGKWEKWARAYQEQFGNPPHYEIP